MESIFARAVISGLVAVVVGVIATFIVEIFIPTANLDWALIAVGFASFFSGLAGYLSRYSHETFSQEATTSS